jgi:hypothetical protein
MARSIFLPHRHLPIPLAKAIRRRRHRRNTAFALLGAGAAARRTAKLAKAALR